MKVSVSCLIHFTPNRRAPSSHWIGDWVGLGASLDVVAKRKISFPCRELNLGHPACSLVTEMNELTPTPMTIPAMQLAAGKEAVT
jgi:hypothetical protein